MNASTNRLEQLEARFERLRIAFLQAQADIARALQNARDGGGGGGGSGGSTFWYCINPVVIAAGGNVTGQTIQANIGGALTATSITSAEVWNMMTSATSATAGMIIVVEPNPDGTWSVVTQSC